jgi:hypothetical protein
MSSTDTKTETFRPTLIERILIASRIPYELGIVLIAVFVGPLGNFLYLYSVSNNAVSSFYGTFLSMNAGESGFITAIQSNWYSFAGNILWYAFLFYVALIVRHLRISLIKAEPELESLAPKGQESIREIFGIVSRALPQLVITAVFLLVYATSVPDLVGKGELTVFSTPVYVFRSLFRSVMFGSVLWLYCGSLWGLYRFGKLNLRFKSCHEDLMLGTKKLGSLSFSFSIAYFLGLTLFAAQMILGGLAGQTAVVNVVAMLVLVPAGIALFIAPLISTHNRMVEVKKAEIASTGKLLSEFIYRNPKSARKKSQNAIELLALETTERRVMAIKTWPVENPLIGKLALIAISVAATLIARIIQIILNI